MPPSSRPTIYLVGTSGHPNYGDELITATWLRFYAEVAPEADIWLDSPRPGQSAVLFDGIHPRLRCTDTLYHAAWNAPEDAAAAMKFTPEVVRSPGIVPREVLGYDLLRRAAVLHVIGGGYINSKDPRNFGLLSALAEVASESGTRLAITGAGLTPVPEDATGPLAAALSRFDVVDVRDQASMDVLDAGGVAASMTCDDAFLDLAGVPVARSGRMPEVVVCLQSDAVAADPERLASFTADVLDSWGATESHVAMVEFIPRGDLEAAPFLRERVPDLETYTFDRIWREGLPVRLGQRWISTRFHAHLLAASAGCWGVAVSTGTDYYRTKHQSLIDLGSGWRLAELDETPESSALSGPPYAGNAARLRAAKRSVAAAVLDGVL